MVTNRFRETPDRVEFRWRQHEDEFARLLANAAREAGLSQSDYARELVKKALTAPDELRHAVESLQQEVAQVLFQLRVLSAIKEGVRTVHENIYEFRDDLATSVLKLLTDAGHLDAKAAEKWATKTFNPE
ncbi:MAG: hypothetical protein ABSF26_05815 [Thermoguttaceae bacterium]|jgi:hypothetical protein